MDKRMILVLVCLLFLGTLHFKKLLLSDFSVSSNEECKIQCNERLLSDNNTCDKDDDKLN